MSLAIKTADGDFIYFDAVTRYAPTYANTATRHPIDGGGYMSDHYIEENAQFTLSGVISDADFNWTDRPFLTQEQAAQFDKATIQFKNENPVITPVEVNSTHSDSILNYQAVLGRLLPESVPVISMSEADTSHVLSEIKRILISIRDATKLQSSNKSLFTLIEFDGSKITNIVENCVFLNLSFPEDDRTGSALFVEMQIEKQKFVQLEQTTIPASVQESMKDKAAPVAKKGNQVNSADPSAGQTPRNQNKLLEIYQGLGG